MVAAYSILRYLNLISDFFFEGGGSDPSLLCNTIMIVSVYYLSCRGLRDSEIYTMCHVFSYTSSFMQITKNN